MGFLDRLFGGGSPSRVEFGDFIVQHGSDAAIRAAEENWVKRASSSEIAYVASKSGRRIVDLLLGMSIECRKHSGKNAFNTQGNLPMSRRLTHFKLQCGCLVLLEIGSVGGEVLFVHAAGNEEKTRLTLTNVIEKPKDTGPPPGPLADCPRCRNTVRSGSDEHFDVYACVKCGAPYCYKCARNGCPTCGPQGRTKIAEVRATGR